MRCSEKPADDTTAAIRLSGSLRADSSNAALSRVAGLFDVEGYLADEEAKKKPREFVAGFAGYVEALRGTETVSVREWQMADRRCWWPVAGEELGDRRSGSRLAGYAERSNKVL